MRFAAIALATGFVGTLFAANVQGTAWTEDAQAAGLSVLQAEDRDPSHAGSIDIPSQRTEALRIIDLRTGRVCKTDASEPATQAFTDAPIGEDCKRSPSYSRVAYWREASDGTLILADRGGGTVLAFAPGDGVLYESVFPVDALITIVPARG